MPDISGGPILTMLVIVWGLSIVLRPLFGGIGRLGRATGYGSRETGLFGRFVLALVFSVLLPVVWWTLSLAGRLYHRAFIIFTEFLSGVHDWGTYRTSFLKYGGAFFAFMGFNGMLFLMLNVLAGQAEGLGMPLIGWLAAIGATLGCCMLARALMRRMP